MDTNTSIRPDMFQCMIKTSIPYINMRALYKDLTIEGASSESNMVIDRIRARVPGSLGQIAKEGDQWLIGSLSIRVSFDDVVYSVFVFSTGKIKVSGGSIGFNMVETTGVLYNDWLDNSVIRPIMNIPSIIKYTGTVVEWQLYLLNATASILDKVSIDLLRVQRYQQTCKYLSTHIQTHEDGIFTRAILPSIMSTNYEHIHESNRYSNRRISKRLGNDRKPVVRGGRICSMSLKYRNRGTVRFDHGCRIQFMGFESVEDMYLAINSLVRLLHTIHDQHSSSSSTILSSPSVSSSEEVHMNIDGGIRA
jgi:hypothetical protein